MLLVAQGRPFKEDYSKSKNKQNETIEKKNVNATMAYDLKKKKDGYDSVWLLWPLVTKLKVDNS